MAVLGSGGKLVLRREAPSPCILPAAGIDTKNNAYLNVCPGYITGDHIVVNCLPYIGVDQFPGNPEGYASYQGSAWYLGPNRTQITSNDDQFYKQGGEEYPDGQADDAAQFYARVGDVSGGDEIVGCEERTYWIHIDDLGKLSFYENRCDAMAGCPGDRVELAMVKHEVLMQPKGTSMYNNAVWDCYQALDREYTFSDVADAITLESICEDPPAYQNPVANPNDEVHAFDNADVEPRSENQVAPYWECVADLREWSLDLSAPEVDTTAVAEKFGSSVKSLVAGGGSCEFFIDRKCFDDNTTNGLTLMKLLLMTEKGCQASAKFYMLQRPGDCGVEACTGLVAGDLFYETDVLVTQTAVNMRPTELVVGTAQFVTTGAIKLREASGDC